MVESGGNSAFPPQLALALRWDRRAVFAAFEPDGNAEAVAAVAALARRPEWASVVLHGAPSTGKSHLLQAACSLTTEGGETAVYLPLGDLAAHDPSLLEGLERVALVAVDDLDCLPGMPGWQEAVFHLFNRLHAAGGRFLAAGRQAPQALEGVLDDLVSRLQWGLVQPLQPLEEDGLRRALARHAEARGLALPPPCVDYLMTRCRRDIAALIGILERLDEASLRAQRRVTVPLIREVMAHA